MTGYAKEEDLCGAFIRCLPEGWTAYPETGFDILLSRDEDGFQIGVEAKLRLNAKVISQAMEYQSVAHIGEPAPDCRAVLVPESKTGALTEICAALGVTLIRMTENIIFADDGQPDWLYPDKRKYIKARRRFGECHTAPFKPELPSLKERYSLREEWFERCPERRLVLPEYVPDVQAGSAAPVALTSWKIKAIKIAVTLEKRGYVKRADQTFAMLTSTDKRRGDDPEDDQPARAGAHLVGALRSDTDGKSPGRSDLGNDRGGKRPLLTLSGMVKKAG